MEVIYFIITLFATFVGSLTGVGGGVIIKPVLDYLNDYPLATINLLSSISVLIMSCLNTIKNRSYLAGVDQKIIMILAVSSFIGGVIGKSIFNLLANSKRIDIVLLADFQSLILIIILLIVLYFIYHRNNYRNIKVTSLIITAIMGFSLGIISSFLAIGGGPLNVIIFMIFWQFTIKEAAIASLVMILFSQISSIIQTIIQTDLSYYNLEMIYYMIPAAIIGGLLGSKIMQTIKPKTINNLNVGLIIFIIIINLINIISI